MIDSRVILFFIFGNTVIYYINSNFDSRKRFLAKFIVGDALSTPFTTICKTKINFPSNKGALTLTLITN